MSWRDRVSSVLGLSAAPSATAHADGNVAGGELTKLPKAPFVGFVSAASSHVAENKRTEPRPQPGPEPLSDPAAEARRQRVLAMLANRQGVRYAILTETQDDPNAVILALAIRGAMPDGGTVTCELLIPREKYDPHLLFGLIERHGATVH